MLRVKMLVSVVPLLIAAVFARDEWLSGARPCIAAGDGPVQLAAMPWQADLRVAFTDDPQAATVRVQITEDADTADFTMVDDASTSDESACSMTAATRLVAIANSPNGSEPVIYLSSDGPADFKVFVQSKTFTARDAAALIVGANASRARLAAASL